MKLTLGHDDLRAEQGRSSSGSKDRIPESENLICLQAGAIDADHGFSEKFFRGSEF